MNDVIEFVVPKSLEGIRLDKVLAMEMSNAGLRLCRRLCDQGMVLVEGKRRKPAYKVRLGQTIIVEEIALTTETPESLGLYVVLREGGIAAVFKPGGIHSASIVGKEMPSVEAMLPALFPGESPELLNRLDGPTSGLLMVALSAEARDAYQAQEESGAIRKYYLAEVHGRLDGMVIVKNKLDTDDRKKTRVLDDEDPDIRRWTDVQVLAHDRDKDTTFLRCLISKGARHQIRAHLASLGHPIIGDDLYGEDAAGRELRLHHQCIELDDFSAEVDVSWSWKG